MANIHWVGGATPIADVWTLTITDTWAAADTIDITVGNKTLRLTVGSTATPTQVATELTAALNNTSATAPTALGTGYSANFGGQQLPEFQEFTATNPSAGVVVLTGNTAGIPFTVSESVVTAGDGDAAFVHTTSATGPNFADNPDNYLAGGLPTNGDFLFFDIDHESDGVDCLYGLNHFRDNGPIVLAGLIVTNDWTGRLGLPFQNEGGYVEYRERYFEMSSDTDAYIHIRSGVLGNITAGDVLINLDGQVLTNIAITASRNGASSAPSIFLSGAHNSTISNTLLVTRGSVAIEPDDAAPTDFCAFSTIRIGTVSGSASDCVVTFGTNFRMTLLTAALEHQSGTVRSLCSLSGETFKHYGGTWSIEPPAQTFGTHEIYAGATVYAVPAGTVALAELFGGTLDLRNGSGTVAFTSGPKIYADSSFYDPAGRCSAALHLVGCTISQLGALQLPSDKSYTLGAAAP